MFFGYKLAGIRLKVRPLLTYEAVLQSKLSVRPMKTQKKSRFLNMDKQQITRRKWRFDKRKQRESI